MFDEKAYAAGGGGRQGVCAYSASFLFISLYSGIRGLADDGADFSAGVFSVAILDGLLSFRKPRGIIPKDRRPDDDGRRSFRLIKAAFFAGTVA